MIAPTRSAALALALAACGAAPPAPRGGPAIVASSPVGLWGAEPVFGPARAGRLTVDRAWNATVGGQTIALADDGGERRGRFEPDGAELRVREVDGGLRGFWSQPPGTTLRPAYATPVVLAPTAAGWAGDVRPLPDRVRFYLTIAGPPAAPTAWVRETEFNIGRFLGPLTVGAMDATDPAAPADAADAAAPAIAFRRADGEVAFTGRRDGERLTVHLDHDTPDLVLTRRDRATAPGFYPRGPGPVVMRPPIADDDGWPVATLADVAIDPAPVRAIVERLAAAVPTSQDSPAVHALVIARHGRLVVEEYFAGHGPDDVHDLRSAGKSLTTTLLGIAVDRGLIGVDDRVADTTGLPAPTGPVDPRRERLRVGHLASMTSGLDCDDGDAATPGNEDVMQGQRAQPDWYAYTWGLGFVREPGAAGVYCTGAINLIGAVLAARTGRWLPALFDDWLARPLQIHAYHWNLMPTGQGYLGGGARLRPRDFAKLAQLVVGRGAWRGQQVVSAAWVEQATAAHASLVAADDYGYGWWRRRYQVAGRAIDVVYASGNGAQLAIAVPALDLVIAINAGNYGHAAVRAQLLDELVPALLAAAR